MEDGIPLTNRLLSRFPFVRNSLDELRSATDHHTEPQKSPPLRRRRKGSLRTTLLNTGHIAASSRRHDSEGTQTTERLRPSDGAAEDDAGQTRTSGSTTDEDGDVITLRARSSSGSYAALSSPSPTSAPSLSRRNRAAIPTTPLPVVSSMQAETSHDYSETEWWGWIILFVTWIVFVVGMGSCLEIWSWAWDVGETPYAPPELEDDPTLPIVGYYPALIVMTGVMAWVWVIVAWVGMKYFRHAKVWDGEDY
jgi:Phosphatidylinositol N-acetylglucosaminyltransferase subunit Y